MKIIATTDGVSPREKFEFWREVASTRFGPCEIKKTGDSLFEGQIEATDIGGAKITRLSSDAAKTEVSPDHVRRRDDRDSLYVSCMVSGSAVINHNGTASTFRSGGFVLVDGSRPLSIAFDQSKFITMEIDRNRFERILGPSAAFAGLNLNEGQAIASLAVNFLENLINVQDRLSLDSASRAVSIAIDLLAASISERMAKETPRSLYQTVVLQRAKAHIETNLCDPTLNPSQVAVAMGLSDRRLQELFQARGRNVSDWIWQRRLEVAATRLTDPGCAHLTIGTVAYGCGFTSQSHFSRRFKDHHGLTPSEYKQTLADQRVSYQ